MTETPTTLETPNGEVSLLVTLPTHAIAAIDRWIAEQGQPLDRSAAVAVILDAAFWFMSDRSNEVPLD